MDVQNHISDYIFHKCLNPQIIFNKSDNKEYVVPCRSCAACISNRANKLRNMLHDEFAFGPYKYPLFITLTYDKDHLPFFYRTINDDGTISPFYISNHGQIIQASLIDDDNLPNQDFSDYASIFQKCPKPVYKAFASFDVSDLQKFNKRLRIEISRQLGITSSAYRYFYVSEYGSKRFRPHYHGILWCKSEEVRDFVLQRLDSSYLPEYLKLSHGILSPWKMGITDCQVPKHDEGTSSYISSYISCLDFSQNFKAKGFRPFYICSKSPYIGSNPHELAKLETVVKNSSQSKNRPSALYDQVSVDGQSPSYRLYSSSSRYSIFPKCDGFSTLSRTERNCIYQVLFDLERQKQDINVSSFVSYVRDNYGRLRSSVRYLINGVEYSSNDVHCMKVCFRICKKYNITPFRYVEILTDFYTSHYSYLLGIQCQQYSDSFDVYNSNIYLFDSDRILLRNVLDDVYRYDSLSQSNRLLLSYIFPKKSIYSLKKSLPKVSNNKFRQAYEKETLSKLRVKHHTRYCNEFNCSTSW